MPRDIKVLASVAARQNLPVKLIRPQKKKPNLENRISRRRAQEISSTTRGCQSAVQHHILFGALLSMLSSSMWLRNSRSATRNGQKLQAHLCFRSLQERTLGITSSNGGTERSSYNLRYAPRSYCRSFHDTKYVCSVSLISTNR